MRIFIILPLIALVTSQTSFLDQTNPISAFAPFGSILLQQTQNQELETATPPPLDYDPDSMLKAAEQQQILIAQQYEQDVAAEGDCIILYGECEFKGPSFKYCEKPDEHLSFPLTVHSVYIPIGSALKFKDKVEGNKVNMIYSHNCIAEGLHLPEPQEHKSEIYSWFDEIKESDKAILDSGDLSTPEIKYYDNDGNQITKAQYQKLIEADLKRSHDFYEGITQQIEYATAPDTSSS